MSARINWATAWGAPRLLTRRQVRSYLQVDESELVHRMRVGQVPKPLWGCDPNDDDARWDRKGIDRAIDRASTITSSDIAATQALDDAFGLRNG